jgi:exopolysaccharide biosynthesis polyprenyl glycosylphosphotransferase
MLLIAQVARQNGLEVRVSANVPQMLTSRVTVQPVGEVMSLAMRPVRLTGFQTALKRAFDLVVSVSLLVLAGPLLLLIGLSVKLSSRGPVLFRQYRVTRHGRPFCIFKFRTMRSDGDQMLARLGIDPASPFFKLKEDPRLTKVGRLLRKFSLDELPQLLNVVKGEMSLVGPRPLPKEQVEAHLELLMARHEVPAGVTGWWQVQGRSDVTPEEAVRHDLFYIENWSLSLDLYILLKTVVVLLGRKGAY